MPDNQFNNIEILEYLVALYEGHLDDDEQDHVIKQMAQDSDLRKLYSEFIISNRNDDNYDKRLLELKLGLIFDYEIYLDPSHRESVHQITKTIMSKMEKSDTDIDDNIIEPLIDMTIDEEYVSIKEYDYDYAMAAGGIDSLIYLVVPVVVQVLSILECNKPDSLKEIIPVLIDHCKNQSGFQKQLSWLKTPRLKYQMKKLPELIQKGVEQFLSQNDQKI